MRFENALFKVEAQSGTRKPPWSSLEKRGALFVMTADRERACCYVGEVVMSGTEQNQYIVMK